jgi:hypothetical protein
VINHPWCPLGAWFLVVRTPTEDPAAFEPPDAELWAIHRRIEDLRAAPVGQ